MCTEKREREDITALELDASRPILEAISLITYVTWPSQRESLPQPPGGKVGLPKDEVQEIGIIEGDGESKGGLNDVN